MLGTDTGELLIVEGTELKATLQLDLGSTVHSIAAYAKVHTGFKVQGLGFSWTWALLSTALPPMPRYALG